MKKALDKLLGRKLLLMGSKAFRAKKLPVSLVKNIDEALARKMRIIAGEVPGACRLFQDYLKRKKCKSVVVGHAKSIRYNAGCWKTRQYGQSVTEREKNMIEERDSAIIIWQDNRGVIAENIELLKRLGKPTSLYEYHSKTGVKKIGWLDPKKIYDPYYSWKEYVGRQNVLRRA